MSGLWLALFCGALASLASCGGPDGPESEALADKDAGGEKVLTVFAAASLTDAFQDLEVAFEEEHPGVEVRTTFAGSSTVLRQILQGAPADVFASADEAKMQKAVKEGLTSGSPEVFARNREVILVPSSDRGSVESLRDLENPGLQIVLAQEGVPAAEYAGEILGKANSEYGDDFKRDVLSNVVSREADVRAAVNRVALGDADAAFGYATDVTPDTRDRVKVIQIPDEFNVTATYPVAALDKASSPVLAREWVDFMLSDEGQRMLAGWGFEPAG